MRSIKLLGMALVAVIGLGVSASSALALTEFRSTNGEEVLVEAKQKTENVFKVGGTSVQCGEATFMSENPNFLPGTGNTSILFNATYGKCTAFGFVAAEVTMFNMLILSDDRRYSRY